MFSAGYYSFPMGYCNIPWAMKDIQPEMANFHWISMKFPVGNDIYFYYGLLTSRARRPPVLLLVRERRARDVNKPAHSNFKNSYRQNGRLFEIENWFSRLLIHARK